MVQSLHGSSAKPTQLTIIHGTTEKILHFHCTQLAWYQKETLTFIDTFNELHAMSSKKGQGSRDLGWNQ